MSDLRSEIVNKVLNQWENVSMHTSNQSVAQMTEKLTFGEKLFNYVKAHPYSSVEEVERGLGVGKEASVSSYLKVLVDKGILAREHKLKTPYPGLGSRYYYVYFHTSDTYNVPRKPMGRPKKIKQAVVKEQVAVAPKQYQTPRMKQVANEFNPEVFVQELSLKDAKAVFELLKGYFG